MFDCSLSLFLFLGAIVPFVLYFLQINFLLDSNSDQSPMMRGLTIHLDEELFSLGVKLLHVSKTNASFCNVLFFKGLWRLSSVVWVWCFLLIINTLNHLFLPLGLSLSLPYHIGYWLGMCGVGILLCPFAVWGYLFVTTHVELGLRHRLWIDGDSTMVSRLYFRETVRGSNYRTVGGFFMEDLLCLTSQWRGFHGVLNWFYQVLYLGSRLWLVFVLHSFCIGCFGELWSVGCDGITGWFFVGFLGLGLGLGALMVGYLAIQVVVYIAFSVSFMFSCLIGFFTASHSSSHDHSNSLVRNFHWLLPVSLVDFSPTHIWFYVICVLFSLLVACLWRVNGSGVYNIIREFSQWDSCDMGWYRS